MGKKKANDAAALGGAIREARKARNLRLREVAAQLNVTESLVSKWECSRQMPTVESVMQLAVLLEADADCLLALRRDEVVARHAARVHREPGAVSDLPAQVREQFARYAKEQHQRLPSMERLRRVLNELEPDTQAELVRSFLRQADAARQEAAQRSGSKTP